MSETERWADDLPARHPDHLLDGFPDRRTHRDLPAVDRNRERGLEFTPEELAARRSNRRWMLVLVVPSVFILAAALISTAFFVGNEPSGPTIAVPAGYHAVDDGYFSYAVPSTWATNPANTDQAGDVDTSGPSGFAGEHIDYLKGAPVVGAPPPAALQAFGVARPIPFKLSGGRPIAVPGTSAAFLYTAIRGGSAQATVVDAYDAGAGVEIWLMIEAPGDVTNQILASLRA